MSMGDVFGPGERQPQLRGVSGWLLFLCITLMVVLPLRLGLFIWVFLNSRFYADFSSGNAIGAGFGFAFLVLVPLLGIAGGVLLYREQILGLRLVQLFFSLQVLGWGFVLLRGSSSAMPFVVPSALWLAYLFRSERVRNTYFRDDAVKDAAEVFR